MTEDELADVVARAKSENRSVAAYLREAAIGRRVRVKKERSEELKAAFRTLVGMANNLNQLAKAVNAGASLREKIDRLLGEIDKQIKKL